MDDEMKVINKKIAALEKKVQEQQNEIDELKEIITFITTNKGTVSENNIMYL